MISRSNGEYLGWDGDGVYENRVTLSVTAGPITTTYTYDGDGNRVKKVVGAATTYYVGNYYEVDNGTQVKYYYFNGPSTSLRMRIAVNRGGALSYLASDHPSTALRTGLGSTSVWTDSTGNEGGNQQYYAYGANRAGSGDTRTDYQFTGQRRDFNSNLYQMGARWFDPLVGRWASPDTIVPEAFNPQSLNRYSYGLNNPVKYTDPTGHDVVIITGWKTDADYHFPSNWKEWITAYAGSAAKYEDWYSKWTGTDTKPNEWGVTFHQEPSADERAAIARETGIAVFDWSTVGGTIPGSSADAAKALQAFIDKAGLKDVTIVGHSKGAIAATELLAMYQTGEIQKGAVKNMVLVDPPQNADVVQFFGGRAQPVDAKKAGVNVVFLPGPASCFFGPPCGTSQIENDMVFPYVDNHDIRSGDADAVFDRLETCGDSNAAPCD